MIDQIKQIATEAAIIMGAVSSISTLLAHVVPWPPVAAFFARLGLASSRFAVVKK